MKSSVQNNDSTLNKEISELCISEADENSNNNKSLRNRLFSKVGPGSMRGSIVSLSILSIGIGCMALPQVFSRLSIIQSIIYILISGSSSYIGLVIIVDAAREKGISKYNELIKEIFGNKSSKFFDIIIIIYMIGIIIVYQIVSKL